MIPNGAALAPSIQNRLIKKNNIMSDDVRGSMRSSKGAPHGGWKIVFLSFVIFASTGCQNFQSSRPVTWVMTDAPLTLNPRSTIDASGQRINALLFRGLTRLDSELRVQPDLAEAWKVDASGKRWEFSIPSGIKDHEGQVIGATEWATCLENYRIGKPASHFRSAFPHWIGTAAIAHAQSSLSKIVFNLKAPDPYFARNLSALRYFRVRGQPSLPPCAEPPSGAELVGSGAYRLEPWTLSPEKELTLVPSVSASADSRSSFRILIIRDEISRVLSMLRGEIDVAQNALSEAHAKWLVQKFPDRFELITRDSVTVSYLSFNLRDPDLSRLNVRRAIAMGLNRDEILREKFQSFFSPASSFLSPLLPESLSALGPRAPKTPFNREKAIQLLETEGFHPDAKGIRLRLHYKCTPVREGMETALIFKNMLSKIGIELILDVVEPAVYLATIQKGAFQLYSNKWAGVSDGSILFRTLKTGQPLNRVGYTNPEVDRLLDQAMMELNEDQRRKGLLQVQIKMAEDLPYLPLWHWNTQVVINKKLNGLAAKDLSASGALEPLTHLR